MVLRAIPEGFSTLAFEAFPGGIRGRAVATVVWSLWCGRFDQQKRNPTNTNLDKTNKGSYKVWAFTESGWWFGGFKHEFYFP